MPQGINGNLEILNVPQENIGKTLEIMGTANNVLNRIKKARVIRARIDKWD
jgi:hypothetical protein